MTEAIESAAIEREEDVVWRYLAWLRSEGYKLSQELMPDQPELWGRLTPVDRIVNLLIDGPERASARARPVLSVAGVDLETWDEPPRGSLSRWWQ